MNSSRLWTRRMSTSEAGRKPAHPEVEDQPALDDLDHRALDRLAGLGRRLDLAPRLLEPGPLLGQEQPPLLVLLGEHQRVDRARRARPPRPGSTERRIDSSFDGDDALRLVADVDQDLVLVDPDHLAGDDVALLEGLDRRVVVRDELAVDLDQEVVGGSVRPGASRRPAGAASVVCLGRGHGGELWQKSPLPSTLACDAHATHEARHRARTPLRGDRDVLICGASFAGLAVARELAGTRGAGCWCSTATRSGSARPRPAPRRPSGCDAMGVGASIRQTFGDLVIHTPHATARMQPAVDLLHLRLPDAVRSCCSSSATPSSRRRRSRAARSATGGRSPSAPIAGSCRAPLVVDALGLAPRARRHGYQPPDAPLSRGLEVHPGGTAATSRSGSTAATCPPATAGASRPTTRSGSASARSTPASTSRSRRSSWRATCDRDPVRYQGNWIPHRLREATADGVFFAGDSAGHCLPLTAEGIRTAFYFGIACGRELRRVIDGRATRDDRAAPLRGVLGPSPVALRVAAARAAARAPGAAAAAGAALRGMSRDAFVRWSFGHYLRIAHPAYARELAARPEPAPRASAAAQPSGRPGTCRRAAGRRRRSAPGDRRLLEPRIPSRSMTTAAVSWPVIVAAATPPAPIEFTVIRATVT